MNASCSQWEVDFSKMKWHFKGFPFRDSFVNAWGWVNLYFCNKVITNALQQGRCTNAYTLCLSVSFFFHRKRFSLIMIQSLSNAIVMCTISKTLTVGVMNECQANFLTYDLHYASQNFFLMLTFNFHIHNVNYTTKPGKYRRAVSWIERV